MNDQVDLVRTKVEIDGNPETNLQEQEYFFTRTNLAVNTDG